MHQPISYEILERNYLVKNEKTPDDLWKRLAITIASNETKNAKEWQTIFYEVLENWQVVLGGRVMANFGTESKATTFNCFTHHPRDIGYKDADSMHGIYDALTRQAKILSSGGGYGTNLSYIRPDGSLIEGIGVRTPGAVKFMELWDKSSETITMGSEKKKGRESSKERKSVRKGAQMLVLNITHPDVLEFIKAKQTPGRLTKANLSVGITPGFMKALEEDLEWELKFPDTSFDSYESDWDGVIENWEALGYPVNVHKKIKARKLWDELMHATYTRNEPGVLFLDLINKLNPLAGKEYVLQANPCGEIPMSTGVCLLGSINLVKYVKMIGNVLEFDFDKFKKHVRIAIRMLDNINDLAKVPLPEYLEIMKNKRRVGLGVMGLGSVLYMLGLRYGSEESLKFIEKLYKIKATNELLSSSQIGYEKGSFKDFNADQYFNTYWWKHLEIPKDIKQSIEKLGCMRNSHRSMNAPTGNSGILAGVVSGGIEPVIFKEYYRWSAVPDYIQRKLRQLGMIFPSIQRGEWFETKHFKFDLRGDEEILKGSFEGINYEIDKNRGLVKETLVEDYGWRYIKKHSLNIPKKILVTSNDLTVDEHISVLKVIAKYTDMSNSKTVNLPNDYSYENFKDLYMNAWKAGIKGLTTYRDGTMTVVLEEKKKIQEFQSELEELFVNANGNIIPEGIKLPKEYNEKGFIIRDRNKKKWYIHMAFADSNYKKPFALFVSTNSKESSEVAYEVVEAMKVLLRKKRIKQSLIEVMESKISGQSNVVKIARVIGMALRHNIKIIDIVNVLEKFDIEFSSFIFHLKKLLQKFIKDGQEVKGEKCPACGKRNTLIYSEGCKMCKECSWTACN